MIFHHLLNIFPFFIFSCKINTDKWWRLIILQPQQWSFNRSMSIQLKLHNILHWVSDEIPRSFNIWFNNFLKLLHRHKKSEGHFTWDLPDEFLLWEHDALTTKIHDSLGKVVIVDTADEVSHEALSHLLLNTVKQKLEQVKNTRSTILRCYFLIETCQFINVTRVKLEFVAIQ